MTCIPLPYITRIIASRRKSFDHFFPGTSCIEIALAFWKGWCSFSTWSSISLPACQYGNCERFMGLVCFRKYEVVYSGCYKSCKMSVLQAAWQSHLCYCSCALQCIRTGMQIQTFADGSCTQILAEALLHKCAMGILWPPSSTAWQPIRWTHQAKCSTLGPAYCRPFLV